MTISDKFQAETALDDGELTMEELERMAGGVDTLPAVNVPISDAFMKDLLIGDVKIQANIDSSYTSHLGAIGANNNEASNHYPLLPMNMTAFFP
ncbi:hypothetical protein [Beggiatoa alba]|nr:hypothetical protein [Beggiatoa alba]